MKIKLFTLLMIIMSLHCSQTILAQGSQAAIAGNIIDEAKKPLPGVSISVKNISTGFTTTTTTNASGDYNIKQLPLGGPYTLTANFVGYGEKKRDGIMLNLGDLQQINLQMEVTSRQLDAVIVSSGVRSAIPSLGASTTISAANIEKLPVNGRNFTTLIDLSPLSNGGSVGGQLSTSTNFTIDGMTAKNPTFGGTSSPGAPYSISIEAVREFKVVTNQYDVTYGRSGGGTITTATKSGTNTFKGSAFVFGRADWLSSSYDIRGVKRTNDFSTYQYGFSLGGPIVKDKAHFFIAVDHEKDARPLQIADIKSAEDEKRFSVTQPVLDQYLSIARSKYGVANTPQFGSFDKDGRTDAIFARADWQLNSKNLLTLSDNYIFNYKNRNISDNSAINLFEVYGDNRTKSNSLLASLRTVVNPRVTNEAKLQYLTSSYESLTGPQVPTENIPRAIVERVTSVIDAKNVYTTIQLGGQRYSPEFFFSDVVQATNNIYYNTDKINFTFGADLMYTNMYSRYGSELNGRFYFTGMDNFNNLTPYRYAREIPLVDDPTVKQNYINTAAYAQMQTKLAKGLDLMAGIRADYTDYLNKPNFNQVVFDDLGLRTDHSLTTFQIQPRFQLTLDVNERQKDIIRLGAGIFGSDILNYTMINNMVFDGSKITAVDIQGANVPTPNFIGYRDNPATAPGIELLNNPAIQQLSTINLNREDVKIPVLYKANFSYNRIFSSRFRVGLSAYGSLARNNYMYTDANMVDQPFFRLANEGNRGVYVPASSISTTNGATNWTLGRKTNNVGRVLALNSDGKVNQYAFIVDGVYKYFKNGEISASYTYNDTKDNTTFTGNVANTATLALPVKDDPRDLSNLTASSNQFRNKVVIYGTLPTLYGFNIGVRYSGIGGSRYSMLVAGNVNGDFVASNDLAYVFDPNNPATDATVKTGIQAILDNPLVSDSFKEYINRSMGGIAERNGGINKFYGQWDLRIAKKFKTYKSQFIELSADVFNVANLIDKTKGVTETLGTQYIYSTGGFNAATSTYKYNVNPNAGVVNPSGNPYQIQIGLRYGF